MPIPFGCACGKRLQAKDEFAGKKMKCPGCGKLLTIPGAEPAPLSDLAPAAPPVAERVAPPAHPSSADFEAGPPASLPGAAPLPLAAALVHFVCPCGRHLKARQQDAGEEIECPDCGRTLRVPGRDTDRSPSAATLGARPYAASFLAQTVTPWPDAETRRRGADGPEPPEAGVGPRLGVLIPVLLLAAGIGVWWYFMPQIRAAVRAHEPKAAAANATGRAGFDELKHIPGNALAVVSMRPARFGAPKFGARVSVAQQLLLTTAFQLNRLGPVERLTWAVLPADTRLNVTDGAPGGEKDFWVVVRMGKAYDDSAVLKLLLPGSDMQQHWYAGRTYFVAVPKQVVPKGPPGRGKRPPARLPARLPALFFLNREVFVFSDTLSVKRFLRAARRQSSDGPLGDALTLAAQGKGLVIGLNQTGSVLRENQPVVTAAAVPPLLPAMKLFSTAALVVGAPAQAADKGQVETAIEFHYLSPPAAKAAHKALLAWQAGQGQRRQNLRQVIVAKQAERAVRTRLAFAVATLGSAAAGHLCPLWPLRFALDRDEPAPSAQEKAALESLQDEETFLKGLALPAPRGSTLRLTLVAPARFAALTDQLWMPYAEMALNSTPGVRAVRPPGPRPGGR